MNALLYLPALAQGLVIGVDEFVFHRRRGLESWERLGHPLDTLTVFAAYAFLCFAQATEANLAVFVALAVLSSLFVTKDEWVHAENCEPAEHWLHSILFLLHPTAFFAAGRLWWLDASNLFLKAQAFLLLLFALYQFLYWRSHESSRNSTGRQLDL